MKLATCHSQLASRFGVSAQSPCLPREDPSALRLPPPHNSRMTSIELVEASRRRSDSWKMRTRVLWFCFVLLLVVSACEQPGPRSASAVPSLGTTAAPGLATTAGPSPTIHTRELATRPLA